jgi:hypothetical protein
MTFVEVHDSQLESWKEKDGVGLATFKEPVSFDLSHKYSGLIYGSAEYRVVRITLDRRQIIFRRIEPKKPKDA